MQHSLALEIAAVAHVNPELPAGISGESAVRRATLGVSGFLDYYSGNVSPSFRTRHSLAGRSLPALLGTVLSQEGAGTRTEHVPPSDRGFAGLQRNTHCIFAPKAKVWTTRSFERPDARADKDDLARTLKGFTRASEREKLDGIVALFSAGFGQDVDSLARLTNVVLRGLTKRDGL